MPVDFKLVFHCFSLLLSGKHEPRCLSSDIQAAPTKFFLRISPLPSCPRYAASTTSPSSVHYLPFSQIKVLASMGDSATAALFARYHRLWPFLEYRDVSFSSGHDKDVFMIGNMLKTFSPDLIYHKDGDKLPLNVAELGATTNNMKKQAITLIANMKGRKNIDFQNDWKMVTIMVGNNDICQLCKFDKNYKHIINFMIGNITLALDKLEENLPRTIVNLLPSFDSDVLYSTRRGFTCNTIFGVVCPCITTKSRRVIEKMQNDYVHQLEKLVSKYMRNPLFTVVLQPFSGHIKFPKTDNGLIPERYYAEDCFHFSFLAQELMAKMLWNNMVTPVGEKSTDGTDISKGVKCPNAKVPYIPTSKNAHLFAVADLANMPPWADLNIPRPPSTMSI